jgi:DNA-binding transcriptional LysR family regulator
MNRGQLLKCGNIGRHTMPRENINDILAFLVVANERSFTRAAVKLGTSQSALSHTVRALETRLGVRLLTRTTRSVSATEAGERLVQRVGPRLQEVEAEIAAVSEMGEKPSGTIRITAIDHVINEVIWPRLAPVLEQYPDVRLETSVDYRLVDIAADRFDIGVRYGDQVQKDMVAVRLTRDTHMSIVGSPRYFETHKVPMSVEAWVATTASRCVSPVAASTRGSCDRRAAKLRPVSQARSPAAAPIRCCMPLSVAMAWRSCPRT